jgi:peptidyl-prolyl cis-trans isomerase D
MLQNLRRRSGGVFAKVLFGLIIASFALVGVGDMFYRYTLKPVATVGGTKIPREEFDHRLKMAREQIVAATRGKIKAEELTSMGIPQKVLNEMIDQLLMKNEVTRLNLILSDADLERYIKSIPEFQNKKGQFDKEKFAELVSRMGAKNTFLGHIKELLLRQQLLSPLSNSLRLSKGYQEELYEILHEKVTFSIVYVPESVAKITDSPTERNLEEIYKANPKEFTRPEYRDVSILTIDPKKLQGTIFVSDAQITEEYARRKDELAVPETRDVLQLTFKSKEAAEKALPDLASAYSEGNFDLTNLNKIAQKQGATLQEYPKVPRDQFVSFQSDAIFSLTTPGATQPIDSALEHKTFVFVVQKIYPSGIQPLEEVRSKLEEDIKTRLAQEQIDDLRNKVEDELAGGRPLIDVASQFKLEVIQVGLIDQKGNPPAKGMQGANPPLSPDLRSLAQEHAFKLVEGTDSSLLDLPDGRMIAIRLNSIQQESLPPLEQVRDEVVRYWRDTQQQEKTAEISLGIVKEINGGTPIAQVAHAKGLTVRVLEPISRIGLQEKPFTDPVLGPQSLQRGFKQPLNNATYSPAKGGFVVVVPTKITPPDSTQKGEKEKRTDFEKALNGMMSHDLEQLYLKDLRARVEVDVNQSAMDESSNQEM